MQHVPPAAAAADDDSGLTPFHHDEPEVEAEVALLPNPGSPLAINVAAVWLLRLRHGIAEELSHLLHESDRALHHRLVGHLVEANWRNLLRLAAQENIMLFISLQELGRTAADSTLSSNWHGTLPSLLPRLTIEIEFDLLLNTTSNLSTIPQFDGLEDVESPPRTRRFRRRMDLLAASITSSVRRGLSVRHSAPL